jgi:hypothetical protein
MTSAGRIRPPDTEVEVEVESRLGVFHSRAEVLEPVLALDAALHLGHGEQSCRRDRLAVLPTGAVLTRVKLGERCREGA